MYFNPKIGLKLNIIAFLKFKDLKDSGYQLFYFLANYQFYKNIYLILKNILYTSITVLNITI